MKAGASILHTRPATTGRGWRQRAIDTLLVLVGTAIGLMVAELVVRIAVPEGPAVADMGKMRLKPGPDEELPYLPLGKCPDCVPVFNSLGYPGPEPEPVGSDSVRVAMVGDSICVGYGLSFEQNVCARLEGDLNFVAAASRRVEVENYCVGGYGIRETTETLARIVLPRKPDIVLMMVFVNDDSQAVILSSYGEGDGKLMSTCAPIAGRTAPFSWLPQGMRRFLFRNSYLYQEGGRRLVTLMMRLGLPGYNHNVIIPSEEVRALIDSQVEACRLGGVELGVVLVPSVDYGKCLDPQDGAVLWPAPSIDCANQRLRLDFFDRLYRVQGVNILDLRPVIARERNRYLGMGQLAPEDDIHYGPEGHAVLAGTIAPFASSLLWPLARNQAQVDE